MNDPRTPSHDASRGDATDTPPRCVELVDALWSGTCGPEQLVELERLVVRDESARRFYIRSMHLFALLRRHVLPHPANNEAMCTMPTSPMGIAETPAESASDVETRSWPFDSRPSIWWQSLQRPNMWLLVALAITLTAALWIAGWLYRPPITAATAPSVSATSASTPSDPASALAHSPSASPAPMPFAHDAADVPEQVATITGLHHCQWALSDEVLPRLGSRLATGQVLRLKSGLAEITFDSQARVTLHGHAELELTSANSARLILGKITSTVPERAIGFTLETPTGRIVDFGTQFTAEVAADQTVRAAVQQGEIEVRVDDSHHNPLHSQRLIAGQAVTIDPRGQAQTTVAQPPPSAAPPAGYTRWQEFSQRLQQDPSLLVYYTFEDHATAMNPPQRVLNRAAATSGRLHGVLGNGMLGSTAPQWASGRWFQKGALLFRAAQRQVVMTPDWPLVAPRRELTVAAWVRFTRDRGSWNLIATQWAAKTPANRMLFHLAAVSPRLLRSHAATQQRLVLHMTEDGSTERVMADQAAAGGATLAADGWFFVAFTAKAGGPVRLFKNGAEIAAGGHVFTPNEFPHTNQPLFLGGKNDDVFFLEGLIDEFAAFDRALSPDELLRMYQAGCPDRTP